MKFKQEIKTSKGYIIQFNEENLWNIIYFTEAQKCLMSWEIDMKKVIPLLSTTFIKCLIVKKAKTVVIDNREGIKYELEQLSNFSLRDYNRIIDNIVYYYTDWLGEDSGEEDDEVKKK